LLAISRCLSGFMDAKPRSDFTASSLSVDG
jgi:hypothetical protein